MLPNADYQSLRFPYIPLPTGQASHRQVIVVGGGPVGLSAAIDLARSGIKTLLLDEGDRLSHGSRAICFARRTLEIWDRLGCGPRMVTKGVSWNVGRIFFGSEQVHSFNLTPEEGYQRPAFINLQQYYVEGYLVEHAQNQNNLEIYWQSKVIGVLPSATGVTLQVQSPEGIQSLTCDYMIAADGAHSSLRRMMGLETQGTTFRDRFLIADIRMQAKFPAERWFWFDPPFHPGQSVLLHRQPDDVWRIDFQLGWDADPVSERQPERVIPRLQALLGETASFDLLWCSVYSFSCQRMERFRHGPILFAGDAAHCVSPFGARGANGGVQDADNLAWKLALVVKGLAPEHLLDTYACEREYAADENIRHSTWSTDFITPKNEISLLFRNTVLDLSRQCEFAPSLINSGRLSMPAILSASPLNTPDQEDFSGGLVPGMPAEDASVRVNGRPGWFLPLTGDCFTCVLFSNTDGGVDADLARLARLAQADVPVRTILVRPPGVGGLREITQYHGLVDIEDSEGQLARRYDARAGTVFLLRPDQHVSARWRHLDIEAFMVSLRRATGHFLMTPSEGQ